MRSDLVISKGITTLEQTLPGADALMRGAELETGHSDWETENTGSPIEGLRILLSDVATHSKLSEAGVRRLYRKLHETLCARLTYIADLKRYPALGDEPIEAPVFILGLPRAGTTFLHNLLASDPGNRAPRLFEMQFPAPKCSEPLARALREQRCRESLAYEGLLDDDWLGVHPMGAERAEECPFFWELSLISMNYPAKMDVPNYRDYVYSRNFADLYREERTFLQYLQHREGRRRWILKTPIHVRFLTEIVEVFPDALFVHCHRDTVKIYPSIANMVAILHGKYGEALPTSRAVSGDYDGTWADALAFRAQPGMADRFVDVKFVEFQTDPLRTVDEIYRSLGIETDDVRRVAMSDWLLEDGKRRASRAHHQYSLADAGLTVEEVDRMTGDYLKAFSVPLER